MSNPTEPEGSAARPAAATASPSKDARAAKRNGRIAWFLAAALLAVYLYLNFYRPDRELNDLWTAAQVLGHPAGWDGAQGVPQTAPFAVGEFRTNFPASPDPVASLSDWLENLDFTTGPKDVDWLRSSCFGVTACSFDFDYGKYKGRVFIYHRTVAPALPSAELRYEMWLPK